MLSNCKNSVYLTIMKIFGAIFFVLTYKSLILHT